MRIVKVFWGLDYALSYARHFPAINWINSYSLYQDKIDHYFDENVDKTFSKTRKEAMSIMTDESELQEIVRLVGADSLSEQDQLKLEVAKMLREDFLQQNSFHEVDTFCPLEKQIVMLNSILEFYKESLKALDAKVYLREIKELPVREKIARMKYINNETAVAEIDEIRQQIKDEITQLIDKGGIQ